MVKRATIKNKDTDKGLSYPDLISAAVGHEKGEELDEASPLYMKAIKIKPNSEFAYNRLMIIYRIQKQYKKEAAIIRAGIKAFEDLYSNKKQVNAAVARLSKDISITTGLADIKGQNLFELQPLVKWKKRLNGINKKLKI